MFDNTVLFVILGFLIVAEVAMVFSFIKVGWPVRSKKSTVLKCTSSLIFILTAVVSSLIGGGFSAVSIIMIVGFCLSLAGDFWLDLKIDDKNILVGIIFFFLAHMSYIIAFGEFAEEHLGAEKIFTSKEIIAVVVFLLVAGVSSFVFKMDMRKLFVPVAMYSLIIAGMVVKAIFMCIAIYQQKTLSILALVMLGSGALLFIISDIVLAFMYFANKFTKNMRIINLTTYFSGQMLLATSLINLS